MEGSGSLTTRPFFSWCKNFRCQLNRRPIGLQKNGWVLWGQEFSVNIRLISCKYSAKWTRKPEPEYSSVHSGATCVWCVIAVFRREVDENCALLGHYTASSSKLLPSFLDSLSVLSSGVKNPRRTDSSPETPVRNCDYLLRNNPEQRSSRPGFECQQKQEFLFSYV